MLKESYEYFALEGTPYYYFESKGSQGTIVKIVLLTPYIDHYWNLAFGDLIEDQIDDSAVSNNNDIVKLISTIAKIAYDFSSEFPSRGIYIEPVDEKRKQLYNHVFRRNYEAINQTFDVIGNFNGLDEEYSPKKFYDIFKLNRKFVE